MPIKLGIYDFFAFTIPGGIVTAAIIYTLVRKFGLVLDISDISIIEFVLLVAVAYLMGYATDYVSRKTLGLVIRRRNLFETTVAEFNKRNPEVLVLHEKMDWYIHFAYIKKHSLEMAQEIDKLNVQNMMLRNSGFGLLLFGIILATEFASNKYETIYGVASAFFLIISVILIRESRKYAAWFYAAIYQTIVALLITPEQLVRMPTQKSNSTRRSKKT